MDSSPPGSPVHGILQARIQEWVAISFSIVNIKGTPISPFKANLTDFPHLLQPSSSGYSSSALSEQLSSFLHQKLRSLHCQLPLFATKSYILLSLEYLPKICLLLSSSSWPNLPSGLAWTATIVTPFQLPYSFPPAAWVISLLNLLRGHTSLSLPHSPDILPPTLCSNPTDLLSLLQNIIFLLLLGICMNFSPLLDNAFSCFFWKIILSCLLDGLAQMSVPQGSVPI